MTAKNLQQLLYDITYSRMLLEALSIENRIVQYLIDNPGTRVSDLILVKFYDGRTEIKRKSELPEATKNDHST